MLQNKSHYKSQSGNVFIIILLGIFLFGSLMYMFSRSANQGAGNLTKQQSQIAAQEIINYARLVEGAVDRVRRNGCSETEISFENAVVAGYSNPNSPADKSCHIFEDAGGKTSLSTPNNTFLDAAYSAQSYYEEYAFFGSNWRNKVGVDTAQTGNDLALYLHFVRRDVCMSINNLLNIDNPSNNPPPEGNDIVQTKYIGDFTATPGNLWDTGPDGVTTACVAANNTTPPSGSYFFFHVLLAR